VKIIKRIFFTILFLAVVGLLFRGWLYRQLVAYKPVAQRPGYSATNAQLIQYIEQNAGDEKDPGIRQIIKLALSLTSRQLNYTAKRNDNDPNKLISSKTAHCVGYAAFCSTTCNYLIRKYNLTGTWRARPEAGLLYFLGINVHPYFSSPFFKDHDFVIIDNLKTGERLAVDPTLNDYSGINFITIAP